MGGRRVLRPAQKVTQQRVQRRRRQARITSVVLSSAARVQTIFDRRDLGCGPRSLADLIEMLQRP